MPLVILEGPDGSGKSTLANRLLKGTKEPTVLIKRSGRPASHETLLEMQRWIHLQSTHWNLNVIADRHPLISDGIYSAAVRGEDPPVWTKEQILTILSDPNILVVYCRTSAHQMEKNSHVEEQMSGVHANYVGLVQEYDKWMAFFERETVRLIRYDHSKDQMAGMITEKVRQFWLEKR